MEIRSNFERRTALGKLSSPKLWTATAFTAGLAAVVTATIAFTVPAAAAACAIATIALDCAGVIFGVVAITIYILSKRSSARHQEESSSAARRSSVGTDSSDGEVQNPSSPKDKSKYSAAEWLSSLPRVTQNKLIENDCVDDYRIGILRKFDPSVLTDVVHNGNYDVEFLEVLKEFVLDVQIEIFRCEPHPTTEKLKMLANLPLQIQYLVCQNNWFDMDSMRTIQSFSKPVQDAMVDCHYRIQFDSVRSCDYNFFPYPVRDDAGFNVDFSDKRFLETLACLDDEEKIAFLQQRKFNGYDLEALFGFSSEIRRAIIKKGWFNQDIIYRLPAFSSRILDLLLSRNCDWRELEALSLFSEDTQMNILQHNCLSREKMLFLIDLNPEAKLAAMNSDQFDADRIKLLDEFPVSMMNDLIMANIFDREKLEMLAHCSPKAQSLVFANKFFDEKMAAALQPFNQAVQDAIIRAKFFDEDQLRLLAQLHPDGQLKVFRNLREIAEVLTSSDGNDQAEIDPYRCLSEKLIANLKSFNERTQAAIIDTQFFDEDQLKLLAQLSPAAQVAFLRNRKEIAEILAQSDGNDQAEIDPNRCLNESFIENLKLFDDYTQEELILGECVSPENLKNFEQLSPPARNCLLRHKFFKDPVLQRSIGPLDWEDFEAKDVQLLLRHYGHKITYLSLSPKHLSEIGTVDLSQCTELERLGIDGVEKLKDIIGLWKCAKLQYINIYGGPCKIIVEKFIKLQREDVRITWGEWPKAAGCEGPVLWSQFAPHGVWYEFLKTHPQAVIMSHLKIQDTNEEGRHFLEHLPTFCYTQEEVTGKNYIQPRLGAIPEYNLTPELVKKVTDPDQIKILKKFNYDAQIFKVTDPEQIKILKKFNYDAQIFIYKQKLFEETTANLKWDNYQLNHFQPEEFQSLLDNFGAKFKALNFRDCDTSPQSLDFSNCPNLEQLILNGQNSLKTITGLDGCKSLWFLDLSGCRGLYSTEILRELQKIKTKEIFIQCADSALQIQRGILLQRQWGNAGDWTRFLESHPRSIVYNLLTEKLSESLDQNRPPSAIPGYFRSSTLLGNGIQPKTKSDAPYELAQGLEGKITDAKQIEILRRFNPCAQRIIVGENLFDEQTENLEWDAQLQYFQPEEIQEFLNNFGQKFTRLSFPYYANLPEAIDFSRCSKLRFLYLDYQSRLQRISGLSSCSYLQSLCLDGCTALEEDSIIAELTQLAYPTPCISFYNSNLVIRGKERLVEKFASNEKWKKFLASHPNALLEGLLEDEPNREALLNEALGSLENCKYWKVKRSEEIGFDGLQVYGMTIKEPEEMLSGKSLELYDKLNENRKLDLLDKSILSYWDDIREESDLSYIFHRLGGYARQILSIGSGCSDGVPEVWTALKTLDLIRFEYLEDLTLDSLTNLESLPNLRICRHLESLSLGGNLKNLDAGQVKQEIFKLHSLKKLTLNCPQFATGKNALSPEDCGKIFQNNPDLETITVGETVHDRRDYLTLAE